VVKAWAGEECDDGNGASGDGCSDGCSVEAGYKCAVGTPSNGTRSLCEEVCGDGKRVGNEPCDDNNTDAGDGCSADCSVVERGWVCSGGEAGEDMDVCTYELLISKEAVETITTAVTAAVAGAVAGAVGASVGAAAGGGAAGGGAGAGGSGGGGGGPAIQPLIAVVQVVAMSSGIACDMGETQRAVSNSLGWAKMQMDLPAIVPQSEPILATNATDNRTSTLDDDDVVPSAAAAGAAEGSNSSSARRLLAKGGGGGAGGGEAVDAGEKDSSFNSEGEAADAGSDPVEVSYANEARMALVSSLYIFFVAMLLLGLTACAIQCCCFARVDNAEVRADKREAGMAVLAFITVIVINTVHVGVLESSVRCLCSSLVGQMYWIIALVALVVIGLGWPCFIAYIIYTAVTKLWWNKSTVEKEADEADLVKRGGYTAAELLAVQTAEFGGDEETRAALELGAARRQAMAENALRRQAREQEKLFGREAHLNDGGLGLLAAKRAEGELGMDDDGEEEKDEDPYAELRKSGCLGAMAACILDCMDRLNACCSCFLYFCCCGCLCAACCRKKRKDGVKEESGSWDISQHNFKTVYGSFFESLTYRYRMYALLPIVRTLIIGAAIPKSLLP
jgi:cysteine-rich repeat protein